MPNVSGQGTSWNLPNYTGELFSADQINTPFLSMIGGLTTGGMQTENFEFATDVEYTMATAAQPAITETASLTAPAAVGVVKSQNKNVTQIFHEKVSISYAALSNSGRLSGINTAGGKPEAGSEKAFQIAKALEKIARDVEYTCLNGVYQIATDAGVANKTRGMLELCSGGNTIAAAGAALDKTLIDTLLRTMYNNGATFKNAVIWVGALQKQRLSAIYGYAPTDRNVGGINIKQIETDFGVLGIALNRFMPAGSLLVAEMSAVKPVFQPVPEKGNFFYETLAKSGASEDGQIFGQFGLAHGNKALHGSLTGLKEN